MPRTITPAEALRVWNLCDEVAQRVWPGAVAPTPAYAKAVAELLFGTAAHESDGFKARRQYGFTYGNERGAFSLWQIEAGSAEQSLRTLVKGDEGLRRRAAAFLWGPDGVDMVEGMGAMRGVDALRMAADWDRLAVLLARLHYLRAPGAVPAALPDQARYWKQIFNTSAGKGTPEAYLKAYKPAFEALKAAQKPTGGP